MNNIESHYMNYGDLLAEFHEDTIQSRFEQILEEINMFLDGKGLNKEAVVNEMVLMHSVLDYFSDISRLKQFHKIERVNEIKIKAYETYWLLQRKPIQLMNSKLENDALAFLNEKFVLMRLSSYLLGDKFNAPLLDNKKKSIENFLNTLLYFMKFRNCDAQAIELMLLAYKAGQIMG